MRRVPCSALRHRQRRGAHVLMPSTPSMYPRADGGHFASFRVANPSVSAGQVNLCAWFDSRQLHTEDAGQGQKPWPAFFCVKIGRSSSPLGVASGWHAQGRQLQRAGGVVPARRQASNWDPSAHSKAMTPRMFLPARRSFIASLMSSSLYFCVTSSSSFNEPASYIDNSIGIASRGFISP
jgi:hypothetical protein